MAGIGEVGGILREEKSMLIEPPSVHSLQGHHFRHLFDSDCLQAMVGVSMIAFTLMFLTALFLPIVSGAMTTINAEVEANFPVLREQYE